MFSLQSASILRCQSNQQPTQSAINFSIYWKYIFKIAPSIKYIFKIPPSKNSFWKIAPLRNALSKSVSQEIHFQNCSLKITSQYLLSICSSSESLEKISISLVICLITSLLMYLHSVKNTCGKWFFFFLKSWINCNYC